MIKTMKKIITVVIALAFLSPISAFAATPQEQYVSALRQVIALLQQQVNALVEQLQALQSSQSLPIGAIGAPVHVDTSIVTNDITASAVVEIPAQDSYYSPGDRALKMLTVRLTGTGHVTGLTVSDFYNVSFDNLWLQTDDGVTGAKVSPDANTVTLPIDVEAPAVISVYADISPNPPHTAIPLKVSSIDADAQVTGLPITGSLFFPR